MPTKSNAATGQWNQILCRPVKTLIRIRKPEIMRVAAIGRGRFANQSGTKRVPALVYGPQSDDIHGSDERVNPELIRTIAQATALFVAEWCRLQKA
jgi:hypothetical protein